MRHVLAALVVLACASDAAAERMPWYRGFYTRVGVRDSYGVEEPFHAWAAFAFGLGYRFDRQTWGIDGSVLNIQFDPEEGLHTAVRVVPYVTFTRWTRVETWLGAGLSYGWVKGTVDEAIAKRRGQGWQCDAILGAELPREIRVRMFVQLAATLPFYTLYDTTYMARDSALHVYALEMALGVRF
jgi:hypothetical protein